MVFLMGFLLGLESTFAMNAKAKLIWVCLTQWISTEQDERFC